MCTIVNSSIVLSIAATALVVGGWVGSKAGAITTKYYVYEYVSNNTVTKGFACKCKLIDNKPRWRGKAIINTCGSEGVANSPYKINEIPTTHPVPPRHGPHGSNSTPVPNVPIPTDACCRSKPRASGLTGVTIPDDGNCLP